MTKYTDSNSYLLQKIEQLKICLDLTEKLLSNLKDCEAVNDLLTERDKVIHKLQRLNESIGEDAIISCPKEKREQIYRMTNLILAIDKEMASLIREEQNKTKKAIRINTQEQKVAKYKEAHHFIF